MTRTYGHPVCGGLLLLALGVLLFDIRQPWRGPATAGLDNRGDQGYDAPAMDGSGCGSHVTVPTTGNRIPYSVHKGPYLPCYSDNIMGARACEAAGEDDQVGGCHGLGPLDVPGK